MADGVDPTQDDPSMGQQDPSGAPGAGGQPPGPPQPQPPGPQMAAFARSRMGPQVSAPGPGNMADSMNLIISAINTLKQAGLGLQPGSKLHSDVFRTISQLSRHLGGAGAMGPAVGIQKTMLGDQMRRTIQNQLLSRVQSMMGQGKPGGAPGGGGAPPPMPSTPLPGS